MNQKALTIVDSDGRVDIADESTISSSSAYSEDLAPIKLVNRNWSAANFAALWAGMAGNIPTYMLASGLLASGMNWWQALLAILIGNTIVLVPIVLNSHAGTKYGISFPILVRASYGVIGSNFPALMRAIVACGWFGINAWIGGQALFTLMEQFVPSFKSILGPPVQGHSPTEWICFLVFWALNIGVIYRGMNFLRRYQTFAAPFVFGMAFLLVIFMTQKAHGFGTLLESKGSYPTLDTLLPVFIPSVTAMIGSWSTLSLNMPDFTRFGRSQKDQVIGQVVTLPPAMTAFAGAGVIATSTGVVLFPHMKIGDLWNPITLVGQFTEPLVVAASMFTIMLATLSVNVAANLVSPANDLANIFPKQITFKRGALIAGIIGILIQPWQLMADPQAYIFSWLLGYAGGLGAIAGVMISDYWLIRKRTLNLPDLYLTSGEYWYKNGWNLRAVAATIAGCAFAWIGLCVPPLHFLYDYSWFVGFFVAGGLYFILARDLAKISSSSP